ncbi:MAG: YciI family protein [Bryobacteraceae bacterium]
MRTILLALAAACAAFAAETEEYFFGFLESAPNRVTLPKEQAAEMQSAHIAHLGAMGQKGVLVCAGPLENGGKLRGILIYKTPTMAEAKAFADADPAVKAGQLVSVFYPWTGPKGIGADFMRKFGESGGKMQMKMVKYHLLVTKPGSAKLETKALVRGPYRDGDASGEILVVTAAAGDEAKAAAGDAARVSLGWFVAEGVLPEASEH